MAALSNDERLEIIRNKKGFLIDMDGVIYEGKRLLEGVKDFVDWLQEEKKEFLFLTNNSKPTPHELRNKLLSLGIEVGVENFYTSAIATARFLQSQKPEGGTCYVIGEAGLHLALYERGFIMNDTNPDFVVIGESESHNFEKITKAVRLVINGARLIASNPDANGPSEGGLMPATGAFVAAIEIASGKQAFFCGKPSSLMMHYGQEILKTKVEDTCMIGDRMDTDILGGTLAQITPVLVLSGVTKMEHLSKFAYRPFIILDGVFQIPPKEKRIKSNL